MNHWVCDDKSPVLPFHDLRPMCEGRPPEPKGDHSLVSQKGNNYFLRIDPNRKAWISRFLMVEGLGRYIHLFFTIELLLNSIVDN